MRTKYQQERSRRDALTNRLDHVLDLFYHFLPESLRQEHAAAAAAVDAEEAVPIATPEGGIANPPPSSHHHDEDQHSMYKVTLPESLTTDPSFQNIQRNFENVYRQHEREDDMYNNQQSSNEDEDLASNNYNYNNNHHPPSSDASVVVDEEEIAAELLLTSPCEDPDAPLSLCLSASWKAVKENTWGAVFWSGWRKIGSSMFGSSLLSSSSSSTSSKSSDGVEEDDSSSSSSSSSTSTVSLMERLGGEEGVRRLRKDLDAINKIWGEYSGNRVKKSKGGGGDVY